MRNKNTEPIIVIENPGSTRHTHFEDKVLLPLLHAGYDVGVHTTTSADYATNIDKMIDTIPSEATVLSASGDGVSEQVTNAAVLGDKAWKIGYLPFGNFNDLANAHMSRGQDVLDVVAAPTVDVHPLTIDVNDEFWRIAPGYMTMGLTARIAAEFASGKSRESMRSSHVTRVAKRLGQAAGDYRKFSREKLPAFSINGEATIRDSTDIAVANTPIVAGIIRPRDPYYDTDYFGARADLNMANILEAVTFGTQSLIGRSPLKRMQQLHIAFERAATVPVQTDGEYAELTDVHDIFVYKNPHTVVRVLHPKKQ